MQIFKKSNNIASSGHRHYGVKKTHVILISPQKDVCKTEEKKEEVILTPKKTKKQNKNNEEINNNVYEQCQQNERGSEPDQFVKSEQGSEEIEN